jgi:catechol 2,3-dioxygenase-like lactoylglutathione lyase family enzyme
MEIVCVTIDSRDPAALAEFWNAALGWDGIDVDSGGSRAVCRPSGDGTFIEFIQVPEAKTAKNRLHFGCSAGTLDDFDAEFARLQSLGAELAWREDFGAEINSHYRNWVLRDPEGNEFCLGGGDWPSGVDVPGEVTIGYP